MADKRLMCVLLLGLSLLWSPAPALCEPNQLGPSLMDNFYVDQPDERFKVTLSSDKPTYLPGEVVTLNFKITNRSSKILYVYPGLDVYEGRMQVFVSYQGSPYKKYQGSTWGMQDSTHDSMLELDVGKATSSTATLLYNVRISDNRIETEYGLPKPGTYLIKALLFGSHYKKSIESEPIEVEIEKPTGVELLVWNMIKDNGACAYFLQHKGITVPVDRARQVITLMEDVLRRYPSSRYTPSIQAALTKHYETVKKYGSP